jgi:hypothetical protein
LFQTDGAIVRSLQVHDNDEGLVAERVTHSLVTENFFQGNGKDGTLAAIKVEGFGGPSTYLPADNRIEWNVVEHGGTGGTAIEIHASDTNVVEHNTITLVPPGFAQSRGIVIWGDLSSANAAESNLVRRNRVSATGVSATAYGISLSSAAYRNVVRANHVTSLAGDGIWLPSYADDNVVERNLVSDNGGSGIRLGSPIFYEVHRNQVVGNTARRNARDGIFVDDRAFDTVLERNQVTRNGDDGIDVDIAGATLTANLAWRNFDWGIEAIPGVVDGRRNRAWRNGQRRQCLNVAC